MTNSQADEAKQKSSLMEFLGGPENFKIYHSLKSHQDRVQFVYYSPLVHTIFKKQNQRLKDGSSEGQKNDRESKRLRELGNNAFKAGRDAKALELYTEAMAYAEPKGSSEYALALANRSAVQMRLGTPTGVERAIVDVGRRLTARSTAMGKPEDC